MPPPDQMKPGYYLATREHFRPGVVELYHDPDSGADPHWRNANDSRMSHDPRDLGYTLTPLPLPGVVTLSGDEVAKIADCMALMASIIKSGERWSMTAQQEYDDAKKLLAPTKG